MTESGTLFGTVVSLVSQGCLVESGGAQFRCVLRGIQKFGKRQTKNLLAVGDVVDFSPTGNGEGAIVGIRERRTELAREASGGKWEQIVAANADCVVAISSLRDPPFRPGVVDRICVAAEAGGLTPVVCLNKTDLEREGDREKAAYLGGSGYKVLFTSAATGDGIDALRAELEGRLTVLIGHSGVGKSSLLMALKPGLELKVETVSRKSGKGKHTTTAPVMHDFSGGTRVIDTPGIRDFRFSGIGRADLPRLIPEFSPLSGGCRLPDCMHREEPDCAVRDAVRIGRIHGTRYEGYLKMLQSFDEGGETQRGRYFIDD